jgi:hypothetical protein
VWTTTPSRSPSFGACSGCAGPTAQRVSRPGRARTISRCCPSSIVDWPGSSRPLRTGRLDEAREQLRPLLEAEPRWADFVRSLADRELLPNADKLLEG